MFPAALRPFFQWCDSTWVSQTIRDSRWMFAGIEIVHLLGLAVLLGSLLVLDLRLLGRGMKRSALPLVAAELAPWTGGGLALMVSTGTLLFLSEAMKCYASPPFAVKMMLLAAALGLHLALARSVRREPAPGWTKPAAALSLLLWFGVGVAGRAIGFQ